MKTVSVRIKRIDQDMPLPQYAYQGDAGLDIRSAETVDIAPYDRKLVSTGIAVAIPDGYAGFMQPRSGLAIREGLSLVNTPGLIDAHYRGELKVILINLDANKPIHIDRGDRIAQLVIQEVPLVCLEEAVDLDETDRGVEGFGSSGK